MHSIIKIFLLPVILFSSLFQGHAQSGRLHKADKSFSYYNFQKSIELYLKIAEKGYKASNQVHVNTRLGDSYRLTNDTKNAEVWYQKAIAGQGCDTITYYHYAQVLRSNKKYEESGIWMKKFLDLNPKDREAVEIMANFKDYEKLLEDSGKISIEWLEINSALSDYSPAFFKDRIIFVSSRDSISARRSSWTDEPFYSLYEFRLDSMNKLLSYNRLFGEVNTKYHEGPVAYDNASGILYFTRNNYFKGKKGESKDNATYLKIYQASYKEGKWVDIKELPFNSDEYSCAHPAISPDGAKLYFISNMPGGYGGTDIYYCNKTDSGWSKPENMGKPVNTLANELFPSFSDEGIFYFASEGHPGLGGMDIFSFSDGKLKNLGYPINTNFDDFGICTHFGDKGYFTSNRRGGLTRDDIYYFKINQPPVANEDKAFIEIIANNFNIDTLYIPVLKNDTDPNRDLDTTKITLFSKSNKLSIALPDERGTIIYLPEKGYKGVDTLQYVVYDKTGLTDTANVFVYIFGKNPPVAKLDRKYLEKNSKNNEINVLENDSDPDGNLVPDSVEIVKEPTNGIFAISKGLIKYSPNKDFTGKDFLVYRIFDTDGLKDEDSLLIDVKGKVITKDFELSLTINFETGKWNILPQAALMLDSVVNILNEYPNLEIELGAHTDSRGSVNANQTLSQKRAESSVAYIVSKGIDEKRLVAYGYGESELINRCKDGVNCSAAEHAANRRVTIKVTKF
ncbi:MAG: Ig-like domain-containing protein [Bacteroidales bacterium]